jgi:hypothetical protein
MKRIWRRKWLVIAAAVAIFLTVGAVAWAAAGNGSATGAASTAVATDNTAATVAPAAAGTDSSTTAGGLGAAVRKALHERRQQIIKNREALLQSLRKDMTPADQALYDQLVAKAKEQRTALQQARQDLTQTLKQLRDLANKYRNTAGSTTG